MEFAFERTKEIGGNLPSNIFNFIILLTDYCTYIIRSGITYYFNCTMSRDRGTCFHYFSRTP